MEKETKIVIGIGAGLLALGVGYYLYKRSKTVTGSSNQPVNNTGGGNATGMGTDGSPLPPVSTTGSSTTPPSTTTTTPPITTAINHPVCAFTASTQQGASIRQIDMSLITAAPSITSTTGGGLTSLSDQQKIERFGGLSSYSDNKAIRFL